MGRWAHCGNCVATNRLTSAASMCTVSGCMFSASSKEPVHDVEPDAAESRMREGLGNGPDDLKSQLLPESHGDVVRCHDRIELHRGVALLLGPREHVLAECAPNSPPPRIGGDHEAGGSHMRAWTGTIRSHLRRPQHPWSVAGDDGVAGRSLDPYVPGLLGRPGRVIRVRIARTDDLLEDRPDGWPVVVGVFPNLHRVTLITLANSRKRSAIMKRGDRRPGCRERTPSDYGTPPGFRTRGIDGTAG